MSPQELKRFAASCAEFGNRAADEGGFVALHRLAEILRADVEFRPLLVEGVIAAPNGSRNWKVLIDSETYPSDASLFADESAEKPLSARLRNTVAHELLHTLSFRLDEFGFQLELRDRETRTDAVKRLEKQTEGFSPFFLMPQKAMESAVESRRVDMAMLLDWRERWSLSREVIISRFGLMQSLPEFRLRYHPNMADVAICLAEWANDDSAVILEWPLFYGFTNGIVPEFILQVQNKGKPDLRGLFPSPGFYLNGGDSSEASADVSAGTTKMPRGDTLRVTLSIEKVPQKKGEKFFAVVSTSSMP